MERTPVIDKNGIERLDFPSEVVLETTRHCNLACVICPYPTLKRPKGEMELGLFRKIIDEVAATSPKTRIWLALMGEPLLGRNLAAKIDYAVGAGMRVFLNTNATYLEGAAADHILHSGIDSVIVSMDATTKETYAQIRRQGEFERVERNVGDFLDRARELGSSAPKLVVQFIVMDENEHEADEFKAKWLERGAVVKMRLKLGWGLAVETTDLRKAKVERFPCPWLLRTMSIQWNGIVNQCDGDYEGQYSPGDVTRQTLSQLWHGELAARRDRHWSGDFNHELCRDCMDWSGGRAQFYS
jgi:MoaA/NifB/PqqE/SkfB family radical SAM enzyme